ncbi:hypothetical protein [Sansalvadorimonas verongulae]|uniref:hypothetical protein n=1 Tax=Sansalvadorimonas verongulae TaxID=2172824 RepID=UPI0012BCF92A|nr:hypothetical protein [Sansalvadorimonas verongulae]MTI12726.1 hypothetical protein [Sansalvadorimonas verongulae]
MKKAASVSSIDCSKFGHSPNVNVIGEYIEPALHGRTKSTESLHEYYAGDSRAQVTSEHSKEKTAFNYLDRSTKVKPWKLSADPELVTILAEFNRVNAMGVRGVNEFWESVAYRLCRWIVLSAWSEEPEFIDHSIDTPFLAFMDNETVQSHRSLVVPLVPEAVPDGVVYATRLVQALKTVELNFTDVTATQGVWRDTMQELLYVMRTSIDAVLGEVTEKKFKGMKEKPEPGYALKLSKKVIQGMASLYINYIRYMSQEIESQMEGLEVQQGKEVTDILVDYQQDIRFVRYSLENFERIFRFHSPRDLELGLYFIQRVSVVLGSSHTERSQKDFYTERLGSLSALGKLWQRRIELDSDSYSDEESYQEEYSELLDQLSEDEYLSIVAFINDLLMGETNGFIPLPRPEEGLTETLKEREKVWEHRIVKTESGDNFIPSIVLFNEVYYDSNMLKMADKFPALRSFYRHMLMLTAIPASLSEATFYLFSTYRVLSDMYSSLCEPACRRDTTVSTACRDFYSFIDKYMKPVPAKSDREGRVLDDVTMQYWASEQEGALQELRMRYPLQPDWDLINSTVLLDYINSLVESLNEIALFLRSRTPLDSQWEDRLNDHFSQTDLLLSDTFGNSYDPVMRALQTELSNLVRTVRILQRSSGGGEF